VEKRTAFLIIRILLTFAVATGAVADNNDVLTVGAGAFEFIDGEEVEPAGFASYRFSPRIFDDYFGTMFQGIGPMAGLMANTDGGLFGHGDLFLDIRPTENLVIWPSVGIGGYRRGNSMDLGGVFQFHVEFFFGYRLRRDQMLGFSYQHISNAGIQDRNPAADLIFLTYSVELPPFF